MPQQWIMNDKSHIRWRSTVSLFAWLDCGKPQL